MVKRIYLYLKNLFLWFKRSFSFYVPVMLMLISCWIYNPQDALQDTLRFAGTLILAAGIFLSFRGLYHIGKLFDQPSITAQIKKFMAQFPRWRKEAIAVSGGVQVKALVGKVRATVGLQPDDPERPIEERLSIVFNNLTQLKRIVDNHDGIIADCIGRLEKAEREAKNNLEQFEKDVQQKLRSIHVGDYGEAYWQGVTGLTWIFFGTLMSGLAPELAALISLVIAPA